MSVLSYDGSSWETKLQRIGERSAQERELVFNNLGHILDADRLRELYHQLDGSKAVGIDGITKADYGADLERNLDELMRRIRRGQYRPQPGRVVEIPKEDGSRRPLAISGWEDKRVQLAVSKILSAIYEPLFLPCSFGFRPGRGCHEALKALGSATYQASDGAVVEIDLRKYFNAIPHGPLLEFLQQKIQDRRFLRLVETLIKAPTLRPDGTIEENGRGSPQGSILSPVLANVYLHHVIDEWFAAISRTHWRGRTWEVRYADDMVFVFEKVFEAEAFYRVLDKRLGRYGIELHRDKSNLLPAGTKAAARAHAAGRRLPTFKFLGFTCYWSLARNGRFWRLKLKSRSDRKGAKLKGLRQFLRENRNTPNTPDVVARVVAGVRGWVNYHAVSDNQPTVSGFLDESKRILFHWFNRRGGKRRMTWSRYQRLLVKVKFPTVPRLTILYPTPKRA